MTYRDRATDDLLALPWRKRLRVYLGGVNGTERWLTDRALSLAVNDVPHTGRTFEPLMPGEPRPPGPDVSTGARKWWLAPTDDELQAVQFALRVTHTHRWLTPEEAKKCTALADALWEGHFCQPQREGHGPFYSDAEKPLDKQQAVLGRLRNIESGQLVVLAPGEAHTIIAWIGELQLYGLKALARRATSPLDTETVLWVAAIDRVPIEERVAWVATMLEQVEQINAARNRSTQSGGER